MTRVPKMARGKISLARGINFCPNFFLFYFLDQRLYIAKCARLHISDCVETVYELPLLPNNTEGETFLHKSEAMRSIGWIFIIGAPAWR
jgi:hypothetical protein